MLGGGFAELDRRIEAATPGWGDLLAGKLIGEFQAADGNQISFDDGPREMTSVSALAVPARAQNSR